MCCLSGIPLIYLLSFVFSNALNAFAFINFLLFLLMSQVLFHLCSISIM